MMFDVNPASDEMSLLTSAASAMGAQRTVLDLAARNVAAAQASTPAHPYARLVARFGAPPERDTDIGTEPDSGDDAGDAETLIGVRSEPGTGDAVTEMIAVLDAQRAYEQNASIFDTAKRLAERTIDIGRS